MPQLFTFFTILNVISACAFISTHYSTKLIPRNRLLSTQVQMEGAATKGPFIDIGANLLDPMFQGVYHGSRKHESDLPAVLERAWENGVEKIIITAGTLAESRAALELARTDARLYCTVGVHPTRCREFEEAEDPQGYLDELIAVCEEGKAEGKVVAVGEFGLDYDRLQFCDKETQLTWFERQFELVDRTGLPLFLHNRNTGEDFYQVMANNRERFQHGVVHSFTGSLEEARHLLDLGLYIGVNGCSLKTEENLEAVKSIPIERIMLETDAPWCEIRASHAGFSLIQTKFQSKKNSKFEPGCCVKSRYEPCHMIQVAEVVAGVRESEFDELVTAAYSNTHSVFFPHQT